MDTPRVLIVEDEPRYRATLVDMVRVLGFDPHPAGAAERALHMAAQTQYSLAIIDLNLPGMGGLELLEKLHADHPTLRAIILTGYGDLEAAQKAIRLDVVDFLTKPCPMGLLEEALGRAWRLALPGPTVAPPVENAPDMEPQDQSNKEDTTSLAALEKRHILDVLHQHQGNRRAAAAALGISERKLYYRLAEYGWKD